jgi:hypothetical protein
VLAGLASPYPGVAILLHSWPHKLILHSSKDLWVEALDARGWRECHEVVPGWSPHGAGIACRSSACPENIGADWRFWEDGNPEDG